MKHAFCLPVVLSVLTLILTGCAAGPSCNDTTGGAGTPSIAFKSVPPIGSTNSLQGQVLHVVPASYYAAVFIYVGGGWWIKPYDDSPETGIHCDGTFSTDITTGGNDPQASAITAFLLPKGFMPPLLGGESELPGSLYAAAVATVTVTR
jgi:hypothetical protein